MKIEKFEIITLIKNLIIFTEVNLDNFPKKDIEIKSDIRKNIYDLLLMAYEANTLSSIENRKIIIEKITSRLKYLDFLFNMCVEKKIINYKRYVRFGESLDKIIRYTLSWYKSI